MTETVGVILAGGLSRRFGSPKAFAQLGDLKFYEIAIKALTAQCDEIIIVTRPELVKDFQTDAHVIIDKTEYAGRGPLAGILSAIEFVQADRYIVLPCDMPYVSEAVIGKLETFHEKDITAVILEGRAHPLVSIWDSHLKSELQKALNNNQLSVMKLLAESEATWIEGSSLTDGERLVFTNMNTPDELERG
ncbi:molybdenum cofactor guanylyltransferase [Filibacter tadaridae]|uniref:Probable molybdenum cofactor guanylyltransferase n=1 Tax=Filibacter tadaridae TaxID=2483811 RepID=A0A3P5WIT5_9BACL|nr:molybdenum cofactor guanylyltransferase [Filibacter tadaridae]VDC23623.1 putative molybdenum cofactor guanylyltransferase [Filibacter tadaridae]